MLLAAPHMTRGSPLGPPAGCRTPYAGSAQRVGQLHATQRSRTYRVETGTNFLGAGRQVGTCPQARLYSRLITLVSLKSFSPSSPSQTILDTPLKCAVRPFDRMSCP